MSTRESLRVLRSKNPWPLHLPDGNPIPWALEAGGKHLVQDQIERHRVKTILEIGVFLGGSARQWLALDPELHVIAVDPWEGGPWVGEFARRHNQPAWIRKQLTRDDEAFYESFLINLWPHRERVTPIRGLAMDVLESIHRAGVQPDLVYLDGDKSGQELELCHHLFPDAILTGDDWFCGIDRFWKPDRGYPIRLPVRDFCRRFNKTLLVDRSTWVISDDPTPLKYHMVDGTRYRMKSIRRRFRGAFRNLLGLDRAA